MRLMIVGCGYVGSQLCRDIPADWKTYALTRDSSRLGEFEQLEVEPVVGNCTISF